MINSYMRDVGICLKENSLLISVAKSTTLSPEPRTANTHQFQTHPKAIIEDTQLPLRPKILRVIMDPYLSFHKHCNYMTDRTDKRNYAKDAGRIVMETGNGAVLLTYNALGKSIAPMMHQSGAPTQVTRALRRYRMQLCGRPPGLTRWPVLTIFTRCPLH